MWRVAVLVAVFCGFMHVAFAGEVETVPPPPPAILNDPGHTVDVAKELLSYLSPSYELVVDFHNGDTYQGLSGSVYNFVDNKVKVASWRVGASTGMALYTGLGLDLPGIGQRYVPQSVKDTVLAATPDILWTTVGKYGRVSIVGGWSWDHHDPVVATTFGLGGTF